MDDKCITCTGCGGGYICAVHDACPTPPAVVLSTALLEAACWYCGAKPTSAWKVNADDGTAIDMPMCERHGMYVDSALQMRADGDHAGADRMDNFDGIETRPEFSTWTPPNTECPVM